MLFDWPPLAFYVSPAVSGQKEEYTYYVTYDRVSNTFSIEVDSVHDDEQYEVMSREQFEQLCNTKYLEQ